MFANVCVIATFADHPRKPGGDRRDFTSQDLETPTNRSDPLFNYSGAALFRTPLRAYDLLVESRLILVGHAFR